VFYALLGSFPTLLLLFVEFGLLLGETRLLFLLEEVGVRAGLASVLC